MRSLRIAAVLFVLYSVATLVNLAFYVSWSGVADPVPRAVIRVVLLTLIAAGLWRRQRWAWWLGVLGAGWLVIGGVITIVSGRLGTLAERRPYPTVDYTYFIIGFAAALGGLLLLLAPSGRAAIWAASSNAPAV
jgi:hypothetical protein